MTVGKFINLSEPQFPHWPVSAHFEGLLRRFNSVTHLLSTYCIPYALRLGMPITQTVQRAPLPSGFPLALTPREPQKVTGGKETSEAGYPFCSFLPVASLGGQVP